MIFTETEIAGVFLIEPEVIEDERGHFARSFCTREFADHGIDFLPVQSNISANNSAYTLRGMHFHAAPHEETKLVRCSAGKIFDVAVDIRPHSPSFRNWIGVELSRKNGRALFIPAGCAHGFLTLEDDSEVFYQMSPAYTPGHDRGFRWDDPVIGIDWPGEPKVISARDAGLGSLEDAIQ
ncbi:dTDP-4-dehydrorhamnose 3,5-epimerase [Sneathiella chungangensis]|uniref:dTDP-4-dehydrorhamnose 3,5-epimerase n=1 Tax=Sneathiella chungangensis TaxID=1418234 RepID=A0A845MF65_9PROT|nr:dTDP-4-dehydrorhamnose 3,5-epimerase [Sneathiella chungangensis]MZR22060.1 dTDP-4-dehydrorhamnose 3,5-epimerase [Sneathiella chungangensis]